LKKLTGSRWNFVKIRSGTQGLKSIGRSFAFK
jgi:hypothetical protein